MFVRYYTDIDMPFEVVEQAILDVPERWLPAIALDAESNGDRLLMEVGFGAGRSRVEKGVTAEVGEAQRLGGRTILPMTWMPGDPGRLFPKLEADVELSALGAARTQLAISARYRPPLGAVGHLVDRTMLHLVAEATIKDFLDRVAESLRGAVSAATHG
jgi:hypothetical protein